jgi:predicted outer membrane repeat protein
MAVKGRRGMLRWLISLMLVSAFFASPAPTATAALSVAPGAGVVGDGTPGSCTQAELHLKLAGGGLVTFACGGPKTILLTTPETITLTSTLDGAGLITLDGDLGTRLFEVSAAGSLALRNITLIGGSSAGSDGGAISNHGTLSLYNSTIAQSLTDNLHSGGAIFSDGPLSIISSTIHFNRGGSGAAVFANFAAATVVISDTEFFDNETTNGTFGLGGAIWIGQNARLTLTGGSLHNNEARRGGALYLSPNAVVTITNSAGGTTFENNRAVVMGGAIYNDEGSLTVTGALLRGNRVMTDTVEAAGGGAIFSDGLLTIRDSSLVLNRAHSGGGLAAISAVLFNTHFLSNTTEGDGGGAFFSANALISGGTFQNNHCLRTIGCVGGGLYVENLAVLTGTQVISNTSQGTGGGMAAAGNIFMTGGLFQNNRCLPATCGGGGLATESSITLTDTQVISNSSGNRGGGVSADSGLTISGGRVEANTCWDTICLGGGLISGGALALTGTLVLSNTSGADGGGTYSDAATSLSGGLFQNNRCLSDDCRGGGLFVRSPASLADTAFINNTSRHDGAGIYTQAALTITRGLFQRNQSQGAGGGIYAQTTLALNDAQFEDNTATGSGGGALVLGAAVVTGGRFEGNQCLTFLCGGGGLFGNGALTLTGTLFISNSSAANGGGLFHIASTATLINALFARNSAVGQGAAVYSDASNIKIVHNTVVGTSQPNQAAIFVQSGTVGITNTIIASYTIGISRAAGAVREDYNLFFNTPTPTAGGVTSGGSSFNGNPAFAGPAQDDYHLRAGSAAIDEALAAGVLIDVDGDPRPADAGFDIGFDEFVLRVLRLPFIVR